MNDMPSPLGHALGGIAVAWAADLIPGPRPTLRTSPPDSLFRRAGGPLTLVCAGLATTPDLDLLLGFHRTASHSLVAALIVTIVAAVVTGWVTRGSKQGSQDRGGRHTLRIALTCGAAYASHLGLDWLGVDPTKPSGIQLLWPWSRTWFISGADLFGPTERRQLWSLATWQANGSAAAWETAMLLPLLVALWLVRVKALAGLAPQLARRDHAPQERTGPIL